MRTLQREWLSAGAAATIAVAISVLVLHTRPAALAAVTVPFLGAASIALCVGSTFDRWSTSQRARAGAVMAWCIAAGGALAAITVLA